MGGAGGADPTIAAVATAAAPHRLPQSELKAFARQFFAQDFPAIDRLLAVFDKTGIDERQLACPIPWYREPHGFVEKNAVYRRVALQMAEAAADEALDAAGIDRDTIDSIVFVSTTGISTPSLDAQLIQRLGLSRSAARVPIWGLGCAGGAAGLARAAELVRARGRPCLVVAVEVCSATFMHGDRSKSNLVATALFGDGAAAAVVTLGGPGPAVLGSHSHLLDDTDDVMGWTLEHDGLRVRFARSIPAIVEAVIPRFVTRAVGTVGAAATELAHYVVHPGGAKVLAAYERALGLPTVALADARSTLRDHGNMSSPTVIHVLARFLARVPPAGRLGILVGLGPGFSAEGVVFRW